MAKSILKNIKNAPDAPKASKNDKKITAAGKKAMKAGGNAKQVVGAMAKAAKKSASNAAAGARNAAKKLSQRMTIAPDAKITKLTNTNPRREGTWGHESFAKIKNGMTVAKFQELGGRRKDLQWDVKHGYLKVA